MVIVAVAIAVIILVPEILPLARNALAALADADDDAAQQAGHDAARQAEHDAHKLRRRAEHQGARFLQGNDAS
jgi:hypothetical protein